MGGAEGAKGAQLRNYVGDNMSDLRKAAQQALEALEIASRNGADGLKRYELKELDDAITALRAALAQPEQLVVGGDDLPTLTKWTPMPEYAAKSAAVPGRAEALKQAGYTLRARQLPEEDEPVAYTDDVTRIMREAGMTFHLGLPHKAVIEQMTRVVDLVCAEASIKAAQKFAVALAQPEPEPVTWRYDYTRLPQRKPLTNGEIYTAYITATNQTLRAQDEKLALEFARAIEQAHGIGGES